MSDPFKQKKQSTRVSHIGKGIIISKRTSEPKETFGVSEPINLRNQKSEASQL